MPILIDHEQRRAEVLEIAIDLIAEGGIELASLRSIAERAGCSTAICSHYFRNKAELLRMAFERTIEQTSKRVEDALARRRSALSVLEVLLPLERAAGRSWKIWFAFWGLALADSAHRHAQAARSKEGQDLIRRVLEHFDEIPASAAGGREKQSRRLVALIAGIAALATYDPDGWSADRQRSTLAAELASLARE